MKNWFIVQSHSNFENKVSSLIKEEAEKAKIADKFEEIVVPTHDVTEVKRGKRVQRKTSKTSQKFICKNGALRLI